jgi:hypothetical protein
VKERCLGSEALREIVKNVGDKKTKKMKKMNIYMFYICNTMRPDGWARTKCRRAVQRNYNFSFIQPNIGW